MAKTKETGLSQVETLGEEFEVIPDKKKHATVRYM